MQTRSVYRKKIKTSLINFKLVKKNPDINRIKSVFTVIV